MRRGFSIALATAGALVMLLGIVAALGGAGGRPTFVVSPLVFGAALAAAGLAGLRGGATAPSGSPAPPPPYVTPPLREPKPGEPPVIHVGLVYPGWNWTPDNPLGGSAAWNRFRNPASWDWESHSRRTLRWRVDGAPSDRVLRKAAAKACAAARRALERRGGVKVHGEARPAGGGIDLVLHLDVHSMQVTEANRDACVRAFASAFEARLRDAGLVARAAAP